MLARDGGSDFETRGLFVVDDVPGREFETGVGGPGDDLRTAWMDLRFDINDPKHFVSAQVVQRFERDPLIVVAAAMSEVYEVAAARHELPVVFGALNCRTQGAVGNVPVTQPCNRVAPANAQGFGGVGGDPTGMERGRLRIGGACRNDAQP